MSRISRVINNQIDDAQKLDFDPQDVVPARRSRPFKSDCAKWCNIVAPNTCNVPNNNDYEDGRKPIIHKMIGMME